MESVFAVIAAVLLVVNTRAHNIITAQREAHEELQKAFLQMVRTGRAA